MLYLITCVLLNHLNVVYLIGYREQGRSRRPVRRLLSNTGGDDGALDQCSCSGDSVKSDSGRCGR